MMTTTMSRGSAKIYQFPSGPRLEASARRALKAAAALKTIETPVVDAGSGWYHEQAVLDAQRDRKR